MKNQATNLINQFETLNSQRVDEFKVQVASELYAICSGKGGVGKSTLALNLALNWKKQGKRVLLFDADFSFPSLHIMLRDIPKYSLSDVVAGKKDLKDIIHTAKVGVDLISGVNGSIKLTELSQGEVWGLMIELGNIKGYDKIIFDLGMGLSEKMKYFCELVHKIILLVTPEQTSLINGYNLIKLIQQISKSEEDKKNLSLIINNSFSEASSLKIYEAFHKTCLNYLSFSLPLLGILPYDENVRNLVCKNGKVVVGESGYFSVLNKCMDSDYISNFDLEVTS